jgi:hypothetical protein
VAEACATLAPPSTGGEAARARLVGLARALLP